MALQANRVLSGSFAEIWVDGERIAEASAITVSVKINRSDVQIGCDIDSKITGLKGEGTLRLKQVFTRFYNILDMAKRGRDVRISIMTALRDPDAIGGGEERYRINGAALLELPFINYETGKVNEQTIKFSFAPSMLECISRIGNGG